MDPHIAGELNGQHVKLAKVDGEFIWHKHDNEDEMFLVLKGNFKMELRDKIIEVNSGEFIIIPKGVEHKPVSDERHTCYFLNPPGRSIQET